MDNIKELEKYKNLLDSGAITEDEFRKLKQSLLGLQTDEEKEAKRQQERDDTLTEIELMKEKRAEEEREAKYRATVRAEEAKEVGRLEAEREVAERAKANQQVQTQNTRKRTVDILGKIVLWALSLFLFFLAIGSFCAAISTASTLAGVVTLLLAILACPFITRKTKAMESLKAFYRIKKFVVIGLVILWVILMSF